MAAGTPKFKSKDFKDALAAVKSVFDAQSLAVVLLDALERRSAETIYAKNGRGVNKSRLKDVAKMDIVGQLTGWFFASADVAYQVMKEMDRSCQKERHIVASIPEEQAPDRVGSYRAIAFKRERAKFVWALSRDDRPSVRALANRIINEFFEEVADLEKAKAVARGEESGGLGDDVEVAKKLQQQAERLGEATEKVSDLESRLSKYEEERAVLLVKVGAKERVLKQQTEKREELEGELRSLRSKLDAVEEEERESARAKAAELKARAEAEDLAQKVRRLEKLAGAAETLSDVQAELDASKRRMDELVRQHARAEQGYQRERGELDRERGRLLADLDQTRDELKRARKRIVELEQGDAGDPVSHTGDEDRTAVLLDQANLAGIATQSYGRKVNFSSLLETLRAGHKLVRAVAFVVDNGGTAFGAFCDTLRKSGWDLRIKRPKRFADGRSKADWDMGIAMEAINLKDKVDTLILVSGDGDFVPLVRRLQRWGQRVQVASFPGGLASDLVAVADEVIELDQRSLE